MNIRFKNGNEKCYVSPYFPINSIYLSMSDTNPSNYFGGTWQLIAQGRTLVGVDTTQLEFNTVNKTGGEKTHKITVAEMPSHNHNYTDGRRYYAEPNGGSNIINGTTTSYSFTRTTEAAGGNQAHNNLQPYLTCFIWLRTA